MGARDRWIAIANFAMVYEADFAAQTLQQAGIPAQIKGEQTGIFGPGWMGGVPYGGVTVLVPESRAADARELLEEADEEE